MKRYLRVYKAFVKSSLARELEFRANFFAKIAQNVMWIGFAIMILLVIFGNTKSIAGWGRADTIVLLGTVSLMSALAQALFFSLTEIPEQVRRGTLDYVVTRPIDPQFWVSMRRFNFDQIGSIVAGVALVLVGLAAGHRSPSIAEWAAFVVSVLAAVTIFYAFNLSLMTTGIWLVRVDNLWVLSESVSSVARYPVDIYGSTMKKLFTYFIPLALLATVPASQLARQFNAIYLATAIAWAVVSVLGARAFWLFALGHYGSASS